MGFIVTSVVLTTSTVMEILLFYCYFGTMATESYEMMSDCVYDMNWYEQPNKLQKYFILMLANMQKSIYYHGFEMAKLDMNTFVKVKNRRL